MNTLPPAFFEILRHEGVVSILSRGVEPHLVNTWNSYLTITSDGRILIPAGGYRKTEENTAADNRVKLTLGSRQVPGKAGSPGTGFLVEGTARFLTSGQDFQTIRQKFPWLSRVLEITVLSAKQTL